MQKPQKTQSNASGRVNAYVFRLMNDVMEDLVTLMHATVTSDSDDVTVARRNYVRAPLRRWYNYKPL